MAAVAGGSVETSLRLGLSMVALQATIGIVNDVIDAPRDVGRVPPKPIPAGLVSPPAARRVALVTAALGLGSALPSGAATVAIAVVILAIGLGYDRYAKGTPWSWVPFAIGVPLLPVYAWLGVTGTLPAFFAILWPAAVLAGASLAISNARADLERDAVAEIQSVATLLGQRRAWVFATVLLAIVSVVAIWSLAVRVPPATTPTMAATIGTVGVLVIGALFGRGPDPARRQRAWELQAVGVAALATAWLGGMAGGLG